MPSIRIEGGLLSTQIVVKALCGHIRICELWKAQTDFNLPQPWIPGIYVQSG